MKNRNAQAIPVVLASDRKFAPYCSVAVSSLIINASPKREYHVYIFHENLTDSDISVLEGMSTDNVRVVCLNVSEHVRVDLMYETPMYPRPIYYRLLIPEMLPQYDKVIYLDGDVVAVTDIAALWETDLKGMLIGAVQDLQHRKRQKETKAQLGMDARNYFNSGVLLIDCRSFQAERIKEKCYHLLENREKFKLPDQDALNLSCLGRVLYLPIRWNLMTNFGRLPYYVRKRGPYNRIYEEALAEPGILHYAGGYKPFYASYMGINSVFWKYAVDSPWFKQIFADWIDFDRKMLFPQDLYEMSRDIMATGQCGWEGLFSAFAVALRSRLRYLLGRRRPKQ